MTKSARDKVASLCASQVPCDEEIAQRVKNGECELYEVLMRRHHQRLFRTLRSVLGNEVDAQEVLQDAFVFAYSSLKQFEGRGKFGGWLIRIGLNAAYAHRRRRLDSAPARFDYPEDPTSQPNPEQSAASLEMIRLLEHAIDTLPDHYRTVFVMRLVEEMSTTEVADALKVSEDVVKTRLVRARNLVRKQLGATANITPSNAFTFEAQRCDRVVMEVLHRVAPNSVSKTPAPQCR